jgi:phosphopantetheinyl transferase (holo-ACP synthase)
LHGGAARRLAEIRGESALVTLTHARDLAIAQVVLVATSALEG